MRLLLLVGIVTAFVAGCATTEVTQEWKDPAYTGAGVRSVMVVGFPMNSPVGHECTDEFVTQLEQKGLAARRGYNELPIMASKEAALAKTRELKLEGLLICRFLERRTQLDVYPRDTYYGGMIMGPGWDIWPGYDYVQNKYDVFGTMLYDVVTGKTVWSAVSDTFAGHSEKKIIGSYAKTMIKKMEKQKVIKTGQPKQ
jgi:hypothetical protein